MRIVGASIRDAAGTFLHAGYGSVCPRAIYPQSAIPPDHPWFDGYSGTDPTPEPFVALETGQALRLQDEVPQRAYVAPRPKPEEPAASTWLPEQAGSAAVVAMVAVLSCTAAVYFLRPILRPHPKLRFAAVAMLFALVLCGIGWYTREPAEAYTLPPVDSPCPWDSVERRAYANPEQATQVLLYGIIADALVSIPVPMESLVQLQHEVGLPSKAFTDGERYALQTYGLDGWGRPFRLATSGSGQHDTAPNPYQRDTGAIAPPSSRARAELVPFVHTVTSAGPDGAFDTGDDLHVDVALAHEHKWDMWPRPFFLTRHEDKMVTLYHRWGGQFFSYGDAQRAQAITGSDRYDVISEGEGAPAEDLADEPTPALSEALAQYDRLEADMSYTPVMVFMYSDLKLN